MAPGARESRRTAIARTATEAGLEALVEAGFGRAEAARAFRLLFLYVFGAAAFNDAEVDPARRHQVALSVMALPPDEFPVLSGMAGELADSLGGRDQFEFGLDVLLAGLEARLR